jgi:YjjG family noncanonical pyrimidine nucleotidase
MKNIFLVDADDTILDFHGVSSIALRKAFEECGVAWEERFGVEYKKINESLWEALERKELSRAELMNKRFHIVLPNLGITNIDADGFNRKYLNYIATNPVYLEGAENFLKELNNIGDVYIVTNGTAWIQDSRFAISNIMQYAKNAFISERVGFDKPDKHYTQYVIEHIPDFSLDRAVWIGDSLSADIKAAKDAGIASIWYNCHKKQLTGGILPDFSADNFSEIINFINKNN